METHNRFNNLERNPSTHRQHRREVFWQITVPLGVGVLAVLAAAVFIILSAVQPVSELRRWADVSLMWLILPSMLFAFIGLVIVIALVVGVSLLLRTIPPYALVVQMYFETAKLKINQVTNKVVEPFVKINGLWAAWRFIRTRDRHLLDKPE